VRSTGWQPVVRRAGDLPEQTRAAAGELLEQVEGTVGVITTMAGRAEVAGWLAEQLAKEPERLRVVGSLEAKGLEYDGVLLVEPATLVAESSTGRRALYVALSRATQRLTVLASDDDWRGPA
jgi:superfamily I DNA/RNA helicase